MVKIIPKSNDFNKPEPIRSDFLGGFLIAFTVSCILGAAGSTYMMIKLLREELATKAAAKAAKAALNEAVNVIAAADLTPAVLVATVCPNPEIAEMVLAMDPGTLVTLCRTVTEAVEQTGWYDYIKMPFVEKIPTLTKSDPWSFVQFMHDMKRWHVVHRYNENLFYMSQTKAPYIRSGIFENEKIVLKNPAWMCHDFIFCRMSDLSSIPVDHNSLLNSKLEFHPEHLRKGTIERWNIHNRHQAWCRSITAEFKNLTIKSVYDDGTMYDTMMNRRLTGATPKTTPEQTAARETLRLSRIHPALYNLTDHMTVDKCWELKAEWLDKNYGKRPRSLRACGRMFYNHLWSRDPKDFQTTYSIELKHSEDYERYFG